MPTMQAKKATLVESEDVRELTEQEQTWVQFLRDLEPWEIHRLHTNGQELNFHDKFIAGTMTLQDIFVEICIKGEEKKFSVKV